MAVFHTPERFDFQCDICGKVAAQSSRSKPRYWGDLTIARDGEWADAGTKALYCPMCCDTVEAMLAKMNDQIKAEGK